MSARYKLIKTHFVPSEIFTNKKVYLAILYFSKITEFFTRIWPNFRISLLNQFWSYKDDFYMHGLELSLCKLFWECRISNTAHWSCVKLQFQWRHLCLLKNFELNSEFALYCYPSSVMFWYRPFFSSNYPFNSLRIHSLCFWSMKCNHKIVLKCDK